MNPAYQHILNYFKHAHLPPKLQAVVQPFAELAQAIAERGQTQEATVALRKLLEAKDAAVRDQINLDGTPVDTRADGAPYGAPRA